MQNHLSLYHLKITTAVFQMKKIIPLLFCLYLFSNPVSAFQTASVEPDSSIIRQYEDSYREGNYSRALLFCKQVLDIYKQNQDTFYIIRYQVKIADIYRATRDYEEALKELDAVLPFAAQFSNPVGTGYVYALYGSIYFEMKNYDPAEENEKKAVQIFEKVKDKSLQSYTHNVLGAIYRDQGKYELALKELLISLEICKEVEPENIPNILNNISYTYSALHLFDKAIEYSNESLRLSRQSGTKIYVSLALNSLFLAYERKKDFKKAYYTLQQYHGFFVDTLYKIRIDEIVNSISAQYEAKKKEAENNALKINIENQRIITISTIVGLILLSIIIVTLIILYRSKTNTEKILLEQKRQMEIYNENLIKVNVEIQESEKRLKNLNQVKDKWFSIISHDIRSPIGTLLSTLKYNEDFEPKEMNEIMISIGSQVESTFNMIENLLQWSYSQLSGFQKLPSKFDIKLLIDENIVLLKPTADQKQLKIVFETSETKLVWADKNMINLVIRNLLSNALKFSNENNKIIVSLRNEGSMVFVSVKDNGVGIPESDLPTLFTPQEGKSKYGTSNEKGVGFGLILCHDFIKSNGGEISVTSKPDSGSEFTFSIPTTESLD